MHWARFGHSRVMSLLFHTQRGECSNSSEGYGVRMADINKLRISGLSSAVSRTPQAPSHGRYGPNTVPPFSLILQAAVSMSSHQASIQTPSLNSLGVISLPEPPYTTHLILGGVKLGPSPQQAFYLWPFNDQLLHKHLIMTSDNWDTPSVLLIGLYFNYPLQLVQSHSPPPTHTPVLVHLGRVHRKVGLSWSSLQRTVWYLFVCW